MTAQQGNAPVFQDKEGNIKYAVFKNKNTNNHYYPLICITIGRFPFKYTKKVYMNPSEVEKLRVLINRVPKDIKIKGKE
jgi:hypothetical protein